MTDPTTSLRMGPTQANAGTVSSMLIKANTQHTSWNPTPHLLAINNISPGHEDPRIPLPFIDPLQYLGLSNTTWTHKPLSDAPLLHEVPCSLPLRTVALSQKLLDGHMLWRTSPLMQLCLPNNVLPNNACCMYCLSWSYLFPWSASNCSNCQHSTALDILVVIAKVPDCQVSQYFAATLFFFLIDETIL